jgi:hypothetical protein
LFTPGVYDLSTNFSVSSKTTLSTTATYNFTSNDILFKIAPNGLYDNSNSSIWEVKSVNTPPQGISTLKLSEHINNSIANFSVIDINGYLSDGSPNYRVIQPLIGTLSYYVNKSITNKSITIPFNINTDLNENDYELWFYSKNLTDNNQKLNLWEQIDMSVNYPYKLSVINSFGNSYTDVSGNAPITGKEFYNNQFDNYIDITPITDGILDPSYKVSIQIPQSSNEYTRENLITLINTQLSNNSITRGSKFESYTKNGLDYIKYIININKTFDTNDFKVVFYDPFSFSSK